MDTEVEDVDEFDLIAVSRSIESLPVAVIVSKIDDRSVLAHNALAGEMFRYTDDEWASMTIDRLTHPDFHPEIRPAYADIAATGVLSTVKRYLRGDGTSFTGQVRAALYPGFPQILTAVVTNLDEVERLHATTLHAASTDPLTMTLRREAFLDAVRAVKDSQTSYGVLFIDLDDFKRINDDHGHPTGDRVLEVIGGRLRSSFRQGDLTGRFGGDEFLAFVHDASNESALKRRAAELVRRIEEPMKVDSLLLSVSASVGAIITSRATLIEEAVNAADRAMYVAKRRHADDPTNDPIEVVTI